MANTLAADLILSIDSKLLVKFNLFPSYTVDSITV